MNRHLFIFQDIDFFFYLYKSQVYFWRCTCISGAESICVCPNVQPCQCLSNPQKRSLTTNMGVVQQAELHQGGFFFPIVNLKDIWNPNMTIQHDLVEILEWLIKVIPNASGRKASSRPGILLRVMK